MEITKTIKLNKEDIMSILKEKFSINANSSGTIDFIIKEEFIKNGYTNEGQQYKSTHVFSHIVFNVITE